MTDLERVNAATRELYAALREAGVWADDIERIDELIQVIVNDLYDPEIGDGMTDAEADADALASAGWGTDEDYGGY